jgi:hypothetical protein
MNERIIELADKAVEDISTGPWNISDEFCIKVAELIVAECINREELLGAIARGWCSEKNSHKTMDPDLALAIFDEVEQQIRQQFGVE